MSEDVVSNKVATSRRILAWWDVDVYIGTFRKRKLTARPLKLLERALGHRVHVESRLRYERLPQDVWKFEAFNYIDTCDPALAAYTALMQTSPFSEWLGMSWQGFNQAATTVTGDHDDATICAFYWNPLELGKEPGRIYSGGVLLKLVDYTGHPTQLVRPVVQPPSPPMRLADYQVEFTVHIICRNKQDLVSFHWPRFLASKWPTGVNGVDIDARTCGGMPNIIRVRQMLRQVREHDAVAHCLAYAQSFRIKLNGEAGLRLTGERFESLGGRDGIVSFEMNRT